MPTFDLNSNSGIIKGGNISIASHFTEISLLYRSPKGYSELYKAKRFGKWSVLKTLQTEYKNSVQHQALLQKEFEISYSFSNANIIQTLGFEEVEGLGLCIIFEYIDGTTLLNFVETSKPSQVELNRILLELCNGLEYIHVQQIIHRDLKPDNILITRNGAHPKIIDFGLSDSDSYAVLKQPAGTLPYASPEQQKGDILDQRSDIYSLGIILKQLHDDYGYKFPGKLSLCTAKDRDQRTLTIAQITEILSNKKANNTRFIALVIVIALAFITILLLFTTRKGGKSNDSAGSRNESKTDTIIYKDTTRQSQFSTTPQSVTTTTYKEKNTNKSTTATVPNVAATPSETSTNNTNEDLFDKMANEVEQYALRQRQNVFNHCLYKDSVSAFMIEFNKYGNPLYLTREEHPLQVLNKYMKPSDHNYLLYKASLLKISENIYMLMYRDAVKIRKSKGLPVP